MQYTRRRRRRRGTRNNNYHTLVRTLQCAIYIRAKSSRRPLLGLFFIYLLVVSLPKSSLISAAAKYQSCRNGAHTVRVNKLECNSNRRHSCHALRASIRVIQQYRARYRNTTIQSDGCCGGGSGGRRVVSPTVVCLKRSPGGPVAVRFISQQNESTSEHGCVYIRNAHGVRKVRPRNPSAPTSIAVG